MELAQILGLVVTEITLPEASRRFSRRGSRGRQRLGYQRPGPPAWPAKPAQGGLRLHEPAASAAGAAVGVNASAINSQGHRRGLHEPAASVRLLQA